MQELANRQVITARQLINTRIDIGRAREEIARAEDALQQGDREMLEDLIRAATNQALERVRQQVGEETARLVSEMGLPGNINLPGLS